MVLPTEYMVLTSRIKSAKDDVNNQLLSYNKILLDETMLQAIEHIRKYQLHIKKRYDKQVEQRTFRPGDWVLNKIHS